MNPVEKILGYDVSKNRYDENEHHVLSHNNGRNVECTCGEKHATLREHAQHELSEAIKLKNRNCSYCGKKLTHNKASTFCNAECEHNKFYKDKKEKWK